MILTENNGNNNDKYIQIIIRIKAKQTPFCRRFHKVDALHTHTHTYLPYPICVMMICQNIENYVTWIAPLAAIYHTESRLNLSLSD